MKSILIVEDEMVLQDVYRLVLTAQGYQVAVANNGAEGLTALQHASPDLILLDIFMPVMGGREFLRNFSKTRYPKTKIVVYSNLADSKTEAEVLQGGADSFILKSSMAPKDLTALVKQALKE